MQVTRASLAASMTDLFVLTRLRRHASAPADVHFLRPCPQTQTALDVRVRFAQCTPAEVERVFSIVNRAYREVLGSPPARGRSLADHSSALQQADTPPEFKRLSASSHSVQPFRDARSATALRHVTPNAPSNPPAALFAPCVSGGQLDHGGGHRHRAARPRPRHREAPARNGGLPPRLPGARERRKRERCQSPRRRRCGTGATGCGPRGVLAAAHPCARCGGCRHGTGRRVYRGYHNGRRVTRNWQAHHTRVRAQARRGCRPLPSHPPPSGRSPHRALSARAASPERFSCLLPGISACSPLTGPWAAAASGAPSWLRASASLAPRTASMAWSCSSSAAARTSWGGTAAGDTLRLGSPTRCEPPHFTLLLRSRNGSHARIIRCVPSIQHMRAGYSSPQWSPTPPAPISL